MCPTCGATTTVWEPESFIQWGPLVAIEDCNAECGWSTEHPREQFVAIVRIR